MLDSQGLRAALAAVDATLEAATGDPLLAERAAELLDASRAAPEPALLGALLGPLLAELGPGGERELGLLRQAAALWQRGLQAAGELHTARVELELSLARHDLPDALRVLQMGLDRMAGLHRTVADLIAEARALKAEVDPLPHLPPHPRQADRPSAEWGWADAFAGRRGRALVEAALGAAATPRERALAAGLLAGYAGHAAGSAWVGTVVGGPRRLHRFRDRLARNAVGAALRQAAGTPSTGELASLLQFEGREGATLPDDLEALLARALTEAFPDRPAPDLPAGLARLSEHLNLLGLFAVPPPPEPPPAVPVAGQVLPLDAGTFGTPPDEPDGGATVAMGPETDHEAPGVGSQKKAQGDLCLYILLLIATLGLAYLLWCIGRLTDDKKCGIEDFVGASSPEEPDPRAPQATGQMLETLREPENAAHILNDVYQLELRLWQGFAAARSFLLVAGLLPPDEEELGLALFRQFLALPGDPDWPHDEDPGAEARYAERPATPLEAPAVPPPLSDRLLDWLLRAGLADLDGTVAEVALGVLRGDDGRENLDLDADRGRLHPAWSVGAGASIRDRPLPIAILPFEEA